MDSIICDISGTHTRVAFMDEANGIQKIRDYLTKDISSVSNLISMYIYLEKITSKSIVLSIAGIIDQEEGFLRHGSLKISKHELKNIGFEQITILNDFEALSYGVLDVVEFKDITKFFSSEKYLVIGAGTGLGVSLFENTIAKNNEEGHSLLLDLDENTLSLREKDFLTHFSEIKVFDDILSGQGLEKIYRYIAGSILSAEEISKLDSKSSQETFDMFYSFYLKIILFFIEKYNVQQVFIAGGIIMKNMHKFVEGMEEKWIKELGGVGCRILLDYDVSLYGLKKVALRNFSSN